MGDEAHRASEMYWGEGGDCDCRRWNKTCKYCGCSDLHWEMTYNGWRLYDLSDRPHRCWTEENNTRAKLLSEVSKIKGRLLNLEYLIRARG